MHCLIYTFIFSNEDKPLKRAIILSFNVTKISKIKHKTKCSKWQHRSPDINTCIIPIRTSPQWYVFEVLGKNVKTSFRRTWHPLPHRLIQRLYCLMSRPTTKIKGHQRNDFELNLFFEIFYLKIGFWLSQSQIFFMLHIQNHTKTYSVTATVSA